jgi:hypothetical protein
MTRVRLIALLMVAVSANLALATPASATPAATFAKCDNKKRCVDNTDCSAGGSACICFPNPLGPHCYSVADE